ncbi:MAG: cyclic nucleotide-binding domain-containing protein [Candidatus Marinimicrobia bacterium]|jgi:CRP-like cAMP-binding protein|nr:cyclic nucleotide-binding domain-containing protein [Candidatus Neomarinimicrobiota bacterium]
MKAKTPYDEQISEDQKNIPDKSLQVISKNSGNLIYFNRPPLFLANFPKSSAEKFLEIGIDEEYGTQEEILHKGDIGTSLYLIIEGCISVWRQGTKLAELKKGDVFGELILFREHYRIASVRAEETTRVLRYSRHMLMDFFSHQEQKIMNLHMMNLIEITRQKLINANGKIAELERKLFELQSS